MQKILIVGSITDGARDTRVMIERDLPYQIYEAADSNEMKGQLEQRVFNLVIVVKSEINDESLLMIDRLKNANYAISIMVVTDKVNAPMLQKINLLSDIHTLVRPVTNRNIVGLVRKLLVAKRVPKQLYRRFNTNQIAQIEMLQSGDNLLTSMYNLSKGGAYCEFEAGNLLTVGDVIRLKVFLNDTNSEYTFNAKVIWTVPTGRFSGRFGCGFKFVSAKDTYRTLLSKN